jgi:hypothetical protein
MKYKAIFIISIFIIIILNIASYYLIKHYHSADMYASDYQDVKQKYKKDPEQASFTHPFYGIAKTDWKKIDNLLTGEPLFHHISENNVTQKIKVLVLGGSVASHLSKRDNIKHNIKTGTLAKRLNSYFNTDRFVVYNAAFGGGKQPQQYFKFIYLDLIGFKPDIVINLDGFNEIVLPNAENIHYDNPAIYPRSYSFSQYSTTSERGCIEKSNKLIQEHSISPLIELFDWITIGECDKNFNKIYKGMKPWWAKNFKKRTLDENVDESIKIWKESSNKLGELLRLKKIPYVHAVQANQYFPNSKSFSSYEKTLLTNNGYGRYIKEHYYKLNDNGITCDNFIDQRYLFKSISDTVYYDKCCHFNQHGMEIISDDIIIKNLSIFKELL